MAVCVIQKTGLPVVNLLAYLLYKTSKILDKNILLLKDH